MGIVYNHRGSLRRAHGVQRGGDGEVFTIAWSLSLWPTALTKDM